MNRTEETPQWFVLRANQRQERLACAALRADQVDTFLPMIIRTNRKEEVYGVPMFPGYLFAHLPLRSELWRKVFTARGVHSVLTWAGRVSPIAELVIDRIKDRERDGFIRMSLDAPAVHRFERGQAVAVKKGPFALLPAIFQEPIDARRCWILIELLGESRLARAELAHIAP